MRPARRHLVALIGVALAGCGSSDEKPKGKELPRAAAVELQTQLDEVERRYRDGIENANSGACRDIPDDSFDGRDDRGIDQILSELPDDVDPDLRRAVTESFANLRTLAEEGCADVKPPAQTEPEPELQEPAPEAPVPEVTPPEETAPEVPEKTLPEIEDGGGALPPEQGTPPGQKGKPDKGKGNGGAEVPPGIEEG